MAGTPTRFGKYTLSGRLAAGGMGETWLAEQEGAAGVHRRVVLKTLLPAMAQNAQALEAFVQEARVSSTLSHGNIAHVFEFGEVEGTHFLAMEYVDGRSLQKVLSRAKHAGLGTLPFPVTAFVMLELLKGLHYAHTRLGADGQPLNLVHRDVSPDNVMLGFDGEVKLVDFGVAKVSMRGRITTEPGLIKGKYRYLSPEQARSESLDARSDIFSAGIVLYEMLTGERPFAGDGEAVMLEILNADVVSPKVVAPPVPEPLSQIALTALRKDRDERFSTALAMQEALSRWLSVAAPDFSSQVLRELMAQLFEDERQHLAPTRVLPAMQENIETKPNLAALSSPLPPRPASRRSSRGPLLASAVILGLGAIGLGAFAMRSGPEMSLQACLHALPTEGPAPSLAQVQQAVARCVKRPMASGDVAEVEQYVCTAQRRSVDAAIELARNGNVDAAEQSLSFFPVMCTAGELARVKAWLAEVRRVPAGQKLPALPEAPSAADPDRARSKAEVEKAIAAARADLKAKTPEGYANAQAELENCLQLDPTSPDCHRLLGSTFTALSDAVRSAKEYQLFLKYASPTDPSVKGVRAMLDSMRGAAGVNNP